MRTVSGGQRLSPQPHLWTVCPWEGLGREEGWREGTREGEVGGPEYRDHGARVEKAEP